jgi:hypothetical protein
MIFFVAVVENRVSLAACLRLKIVGIVAVKVVTDVDFLLLILKIS